MFAPLNFWEGDLRTCEVIEFSEVRGPFGIFGINLYTKVESKAFYVIKFLVKNICSMGIFCSIGNRYFWKLFQDTQCLLLTLNLTIQHYFGESSFLHLIGGKVLCHQ
jgi:hypothetical protein